MHTKKSMNLLFGENERLEKLVVRSINPYYNNCMVGE